MPHPPVNLHVRSILDRRRDEYIRGLNDGVDVVEWPPWVAEVFRQRSAYERNVLLGILLNDFGEVVDEWNN